MMSMNWRDKDGNVVQQTGDITSLEDGEQQATFVVPDTAQEGDIYTAVIVSGGNDVAAAVTSSEVVASPYGFSTPVVVGS